MMYVCGQFIDHDLDHTLPDGTNNIDITIPPGDPNCSAGSTISLPRFITDPANRNTVNSITGWLRRGEDLRSRDGRQFAPARRTHGDESQRQSAHRQ